MTANSNPAATTRSTLQGTASEVATDKPSDAASIGASDNLTVKEDSSPMLSPQDELDLLRQNLALGNSTVCNWDLTTDSLTWAANAQDLLDSPTSLPTSIDAWIARMSEEDQRRYTLLKNSLPRHGREVDMEYGINNDEGLPHLRIRQMGRIVRDASNEPTALVSTLTVSHLDGNLDKEDVLAYLTQDVPDRRVNDRRGYHYPPAFMKHLHKAITHSAKSNECGVFMLIAVNNLAMIINGYGFETSEGILSDIKQVIAGSLGAHDCVERIHRDQMGVVLADCDRKCAEKRALEFKTLIQMLSLQHKVGALHVTCSIGSVCFPEPAATVADALDKAYIALNNNNNMVFNSFEETSYDGEKSRQQMALANYLHDAIVENRLRLAYQPIIRAQTGTVGHYESLLRIVDKEGKITTAGPLIPIAERMGLIEIIDRLVVEKVVEELRNHPTVELAFNISSVTTGNPEWVRYLAMLLQDDLSVASRMIVEITETAAQRDLRETAYFVASVQALGCQVSLDDFGSGYTSFRQLKALSVDMLKIDGAFIKDITDNNDNRFFVKTLLDFTKGYGLHTVAEFVETGEVAKVLMDMGVEYMQGFYFSQPLNYRPWLDEGEYQPE
ncbi:MAG: EAL domain-containing protein [Alphaproteobacteria bacterium]|nr:EAL domain-containing protein [Alphaproteobacteria bacterium]